MNEMHSRNGEFARVAENLYRYSSSGVYYARYRANGKEISRSLKTVDRALAKRRLAVEMENASRIDPKNAKMTLEELLRLYDQRLSQFAEKTAATRRSILKSFKKTWTHGLNISVQTVSAGQLDLWLAGRRKNFKNATYNEYARFLRHVFELAVKLRVLAVSPAAALHGLKIETPIRSTPSWDQFQAMVAEIRSQKHNAEAHDSADLVEFMGLAGVGTAECSNLKGEHIDFSGKRITLYRVKTDTGYSIPLFPQVLPFLKRLEAKGQLKTSQPVFRIRDPKKALAAACKRLGFLHFSPRSLRRCFITRAIERSEEHT